jgi:hypothetical protein
MTRRGETVTTQEPISAPDQFEGVEEFVGYGPAATYLGLKRNTLSSYAARGIGPEVDHYQAVDQYNMPVFTRAELDRWRENRPGQGARTDLLSASA